MSKNLKKIGLKAQDTAELFFRDVKVPVENLLSVEGQGFKTIVHNFQSLFICAAGSP